jgi:hypothetical protein
MLTRPFFFFFLPLASEAARFDAAATQKDIQRLVHSLSLRDERILQQGEELRKITEEYRRLREELLPVFKMAKDHSKPLPYHPSTNHEFAYDQSTVSPPAATAAPDKSAGLNRKLSTKRFLIGTTPKNASPTHIPPSVQESRAPDSSTLEPSAASMAASSHLTASINGGPSASSGHSAQAIPSPTSPPVHSGQGTLGARSYRGDRGESITPLTRAAFPSSSSSHADDAHTPYANSRGDVATSGPQSARRVDSASEPPPSAGTNGSGSQPSVEIFKSFRVSMDDPCHKVLPAALKKYNINAPWQQYALYIVYGDQERCLELDEKPLILFKQLDREGRKPMFMLRKHAPPDGSSSTVPGQTGPPSAGLDGPPNQGSGGRQYQGSGIQFPPGGVL